MTRANPLSGVTTLLLLMLVLAGCGGADDSDQPATGATADAAATPAVFGKGSPAPEFRLEKVDGGQLAYADLRGKVVLIDFWDTWCPPCRAALPHLQELSEQYAGRAEVVGIALGRDGKAKVAAFIQQQGLTFPMVLADSEYEIVKAFGGVSSIPTSFLINADGVIVEKWIGGQSKAEYERGIRAALGQ